MKKTITSTGQLYPLCYGAPRVTDRFVNDKPNKKLAKINYQDFVAKPRKEK